MTRSEDKQQLNSDFVEYFKKESNFIEIGLSWNERESFYSILSDTSHGRLAIFKMEKIAETSMTNIAERYRLFSI